jgi:hypothetical protein
VKFFPLATMIPVVDPSALVGSESALEVSHGEARSLFGSHGLFAICGD